MTIKRTLLSFTGGLAMATAMGSATAADFTMKIAHVGATTQPIYTCVEVMKAYVERYSRGRVVVEHYPAGQLGNFRQSVEQVQLGTLEMTSTTGGGISNIFGPIQAFDIPYLFASDRVIDKFMMDPIVNAKLRKDVLEATQTVRLMGMSGDHGWRSFFTNVPVKKASDLKGVKIRTIESPITMELARAVGANPTPIPWQELYTSLATGVVVGTKNGITDIVNMKFHEFLHRVTLDHHAYMFLFWWMNDTAFQSYPPEIKKVVLDGFHHMTSMANNDPKYTALPAYKAFKAKGGEVYVPTAAEKAQFVEMVQPLKKWFVDKYGDEWLVLLESSIAQAKVDIAAEDAKIMQ